jgi:iron(III) transport system permease protein
MSLFDPRVGGLLLNTLMLIAAVAVIAIPVGTWLALVVFRTQLAWSRAISTLLVTQTLTPLVILAGGWQAGFGLAGWWTLQQPGIVWLDGWRGAIWIHSLAAIPVVALVVGLGLLRVDAELEERALMSLSPRRVLWRVTLPRITAWLALSLLWIAITVGGEMTVTDFFQVRTFAEELYTEATIGALDDLPLNVWPIVLFAALLATAGLFLVGRWMPERREVDARRTLVFPLSGSWRAVVVLGVIGIVLLTVAVPLGNLLWKAGVLVTSTESGRVRSWSLVKCGTVIASSPWRYRQELGWSLLLGTLTALTAAAITWPLAWSMRLRRSRATIAWSVMGLLAALPGPVVGLGLIAILNQPSIPGFTWLYDRTPVAPWLAHALRALPWSWLIAWSTCRTIPDEVVDRVRLSGLGVLASLRKIILPGQSGPVIACAAVAWIVSWGDVAGSILVLPPGITTLSVRVFGLLHYGVEDEVAGICVAQMMLVAVVSLPVVTMLRRNDGR